MQHAKLGRTELELPIVSLGTWAIGGWYWGGSDDEESIRAIREAIELGTTAIDTAPVYGFGHSEKIVGKAIQDRRDKVLLMTKVGLRWDDPRGDVYFDTVDAHGRELRVRKNARPDSVKLEVERSLERMKVQVIDLVQLHWPDPATPIAETMGALLELRKQGKLRAIGVCNYDAAQMAEASRALGDVPLASNQIKYSLVARRAEQEVLPWAREHEVGVLAYSPLEQGLLSGKIDEKRRFASDDGRTKRATFKPENRVKVRAALARAVEPVAKRHGRSIAEVVLAWTAAQAGVTSVLAGARTVQHARENAAAGDLVLTGEERAAIAAAFLDLGLDLTPPVASVPSFAERLAKRLRRAFGS
jgi:aryl-alcohol dehydrogenase-like predicted oxidoreductase